MLNSEQLNQFHKQGYAVLESVFTPDDVHALRQAAQAIVAAFDIDRHRSVFSTQDRDAGRDDYFFESAEAVHCFLEEGALNADGQLTRPRELAINKIGHAMHDLVPEFTQFCRLPQIAELLHKIGYRAPQLWQSMYIFKQPRIGGEVRWHQDASYLFTEPSCVTGMWVALEDAHLGNGCLWVQPGGQRTPLRDRYEVDWTDRTGELRSIDTTPWPREGQGQALEVPMGSLIIFHDHLPHYSSQNFSNESRQAFTMHFAEKGTQWSEKNWLQRHNLPPFEL